MVMPWAAVILKITIIPATVSKTVEIMATRAAAEMKMKDSSII